MAFSTFNSITSLKRNTVEPIAQNVIASTTINGTTSLAFGISKNGQSIVYVDNSKKLYVSTNYNLTFNLKYTFSSVIDYVCISDDGTYLLANAYNSQTYKSSNYGSAFNNVSGTNRFVAMNSSGKYQLSMFSDTTAYMSKDYGSNWTNLNTSKITIGTKTSGSSSVIVPAISSSGQYISFIVNTSTTPTVAFWYSTNWGDTFIYIYVDSSSSLYARGFCMSNDCTKFIGFWAGSSKKVGIANGYPFNTTTTVNYASSNIINNFTAEFPSFFVSNHFGSDFYFCNNSTNKIQRSVDNLQTSTDYGTKLVSGAQGSYSSQQKGIIHASSNCKYILTYIGDPASTTTLGKLYLTVNNMISENVLTFSDTSDKLINYYTCNIDDISISSSELKNIQTSIYDFSLVGNPIVTTNKKYGNGSMLGCGNYGYIKTPNMYYSNSDFSICFWYYCDGSTTGPVQTAFISRRIMNNANTVTYTTDVDNNNQQLELRINYTTNVEWVLYVGNNVIFNLTGGSYNIINTWVHVALVKNNNDTIFYLNGVSKYTDANNLSFFTNGEYSSFSFMNDFVSGTRTAYGYIDDIRIYSRALTATQVLDIASII